MYTCIFGLVTLCLSILHHFIETKYLLLALQCVESSFKGIKSTIDIFLELFKHRHKLIINIVCQLTFSKRNWNVFIMSDYLVSLHTLLFFSLHFGSEYLTIIYFVLLFEVLKLILVVKFRYFSLLVFNCFKLQHIFISL